MHVYRFEYNSGYNTKLLMQHMYIRSYNKYKKFERYNACGYNDGYYLMLVKVGSMTKI